MKKPRFLIIIYILLLAFGVNAQQETEKKLIQNIGFGLSINAVADEAIGVLSIYGNRSLYDWKMGSFYAGLGTSFGAFKDINSKFNQYTNGRVMLVRPVDLLVGHRFHLFNDKLKVRTDLKAGMVFLNQKIEINDERYQISETFIYRFTEF